MKPSRQCTAKSSRTGTRCGRTAIVGGTVCATHGGSAPQVRLAAKDRIAALVDPAIDALQRALKHRDIKAAVAAARDLLDRAGHGAPTKVEARISLIDIVRQIEERRQRAGGRS